MTDMPIEPVQPIHGSIVKAICKIQTSIEPVKKSHRNAHGNYMYAGVDDIFAAITRKQGEVGLLCLVLEEKDVEIIRAENKDGKTIQWGKFCFGFVLATEEATWTDPRNRVSLLIPITGPQSFAGARSFAEKYFLRSLYKIPTGDMELDSLPQADTEEEQADLAKRNNGKTAWQANHEGLDGLVEDMRKAIRNITGPIDGQAWWIKVEADTKKFPRQWGDIIRQEYCEKMEEYGVNVTFNRAGTATHTV